MSVSPPDDEALAIALQQEEDASHTCCSFSMHAKASNSEEAVVKILQELEDAKIARALQRQLSLERKVGITRTYPTPLPPAPSRIQQTVSHVPPRPRPTSTATTLPQKISSTHNQDIAPSTIASQKSKRQQQQIEDMRAAEELQARVYLEDLQKRERLRTTQQPVVPHRRRILHSHRTRQPVISERASYEELLALDDTIVRHGVPEQVQQTLPTFSATEPAGSCAVCQEDYVQGEELLTLPCAHVYHKQCITTWMNTSKLCPICKYSISS